MAEWEVNGQTVVKGLEENDVVLGQGGYDRGLYRQKLGEWWALYDQASHSAKSGVCTKVVQDMLSVGVRFVTSLKMDGYKGFYALEPPHSMKIHKKVLRALRKEVLDQRELLDRDCYSPVGDDKDLKLPPAAALSQLKEPLPLATRSQHKKKKPDNRSNLERRLPPTNFHQMINYYLPCGDDKKDGAFKNGMVNERSTVVTPSSYTASPTLAATKKQASSSHSPPFPPPPPPPQQQQQPSLSESSQEESESVPPLAPNNNNNNKRHRGEGNCESLDIFKYCHGFTFILPRSYMNKLRKTKRRRVQK